MQRSPLGFLCAIDRPVRKAEAEYWDADIEARLLAKSRIEPDPTLERRKLDAMRAQLEAYAAPGNFVDGLPLESFSNETAFRLAQLLRLLLNGETVEGLEAARAKGRRRSLNAQGALEDAALYVKAAQTWPDFLNDPDPIETIRASFKMNSRNQVTKALRELRGKTIEFGKTIADLVELGSPDELREHVHLFKVRLKLAGEVWAACKTEKARARYETNRRRN